MIKFVRMMMMFVKCIGSDLYVDMDGTVLCSSLDDEFKKECSENEFKVALDWYNRMYVNDLSINWGLIVVLIVMKGLGSRVVGWTNRGEEQRSMTEDNLGMLLGSVFSEVMYHSGQKGKTSVDGVVVDNEEKYLSCGTHGVHVVY